MKCCTRYSVIIDLVSVTWLVCELLLVCSQSFFRPYWLYRDDAPGKNGFDAILLGHCAQRAGTTDRFFPHSVTKHLFADPVGGFGTDLPALNTQRGRDHGVPGKSEHKSVESTRVSMYAIIKKGFADHINICKSKTYTISALF